MKFGEYKMMSGSAQLVLISIACHQTVAAAAAAAAMPPTGRWDGELVGGAPSGHLGNPGVHVPLLGNGYMGVVLATANGAHGITFNGSIVDFLINSNVNWDCEGSGKKLPPAVCSVRGLGGLTLHIANGTLSKNTTFAAAQRMANGTLWTRRTALDGTTLETETYIHSTENLLVTDVTFRPSGPDVSLALQAQLWMNGRNRHVRPSVVAECINMSCSRRYHPPNTTGFFAPWTAIAAQVLGATTIAPPDLSNTDALATSTTNFTMHEGNVQIVISLADNLLGGNELDPKPAAASLPLAFSPAEVAADSSTFWTDYWAASAVELPSRQDLEHMWYGAQYVTACMTASATVHESWKHRLPPPGLYGPFVTADFAFWNGDFTLDYNQEAPYYHVYSSNHPERAAAAFTAITDYQPAARAQAGGMASQANLSSCPASALQFPCHLAPWGHQSRDTSTYVQWNGPYAALLFINDWEYTRNATFAAKTTLPLLAGLNDWVSCYLHRNSSTLEDWNAYVPDGVFEGIPARNPSIGLALFMRIAMAHRDIANALQQPYPGHVDDIIDHLRPLQTTPGPKPGTVVWAAADGYNWSTSSMDHAHFSSVLFPIWPTELVDGLTADDATHRIALASATLYANLSCGTAFPQPPFQSCVYAGWGGLTVFGALARALPRSANDHAGDAINASTLADSFETYVRAYGANGTNYLAYAPGGGIENVGLAHTLNTMLVRSANGTIYLFPSWPLNEPASFHTLRVKGGFLVSAAWNHLSYTATDVQITATVGGRCSLASPWGEEVRSLELQCQPSPETFPNSEPWASRPEREASKTTLHVEAGAGTRYVRWLMRHGEMCNLKPLVGRD